MLISSQSGFDLLPNVECLHVTTSQIDTRVPDSFWDDCFDIIGIAKIHTCFLNGTNLKVYANNVDLQNGKFRHDFDLRFDVGELGATTTIENDKNIKIGDWVTVSYDDDVFPGEVLQILREENLLNRYQVNVMHSEKKKIWHWPTPKDDIWYFEKHVIKKIGLPIPQSLRSVGRDLYTFPTGTFEK